MAADLILTNQGIQFAGGNIVDLKAAMPSSGSYTAGDIVLESSTANRLSGWKRQTTGSSHALGTDWLYFNMPVGPQSMVRLNTANGYGSTNTAIRRFTNVVTNQGSDITYADSATNGASFTINTNGVYSVSFADVYTAAAYIGLSLNTTQPTTAIQSLTNVGEILSIGQTPATGTPTSCNWTGYLPSGAVVRAHTSAVSTGTPANAVQFTITRVA